jgi:hypothetical protein
MSNGTFFERYKRYFRLSARPRWSPAATGMLFDKLPAAVASTKQGHARGQR